jgi:ArsR family transcriptional regulator, arsenate/arsenite/antimonite-responsive transcriptional repressor
MRPDIDLIGDPTRRQMLALLRVEREVCVCEFVAALQDVQPSVSRHLALLRAGGWVVSRRDGTWMHYRLARLPDWARTLIDGLVRGGVSPETLRDLRGRLAAFSGRSAHDLKRVA